MTTFAVVVETFPTDVAICEELFDRDGNAIDMTEFWTKADYHQQVFHVGEILILNDGGREVCYPGRKPSKWHVRVEEFTNLDQAIQRANKVFDDAILEARSKMDTRETT